jgi:outer membrane protein with beta-barrel domain
MRRFAWLAVVCLALLPSAKAQETGNLEVGGFADYYRSGVTGTNMFGLGGRVGFAVRDNLMMEGEMAYDFSRTFNNSFTEIADGSVSFVNSNVSTLHALLGPRYNLGNRRIRPFVELKVGLIDYRFGPLAFGFTSFSKQVALLRNDNFNAALLAGGGLDGKIGPVAMRFDIADEMYINAGVHSGLKLTIGPYVRF